MKILIICQYFPPDITAAAFRIFDTARLLEANGHEVHVITARPHRSPDPHTYLAFTSPFNLTGQPAVSLPMGEVDGLPVGLQLVGRPGSDAALLAVARLVELSLLERQ